MTLTGKLEDAWHVRSGEANLNPEVEQRARKTCAYIGKRIRVVIDRPKGSLHPEHGFVYPVNYGYVPGTMSGDGEPIDVYVLGPDEALDEAAATCIAVVHRRDDVEDKLVAVVGDGMLDRDDIARAIDFQERFFDSVVLLVPDADE